MLLVAGVASSCALVINLVALLQGASVSTSSIILHELENSSHHVQVNIHSDYLFYAFALTVRGRYFISYTRVDVTHIHNLAN